MKLANPSDVQVYTIAGASTARPLPEWLARKRKRSLKKDPEYANRVELLQDFEFEEASACVRVSEDGEWVMSTGTYKPQIHVHYLPHLSLSFARHTNALNQTFTLLSSDYTKSLHLQSDRFLEVHTAGGLHYSTRIPRYGRDLKYNRRTVEALIPSVGVDADGMGEVYRLNLEIGRFMKAYNVDVGGDDHESVGAGALQGGIRAGAVNCATIAEESHGLLAFGTSIGTVELWDARSRNRVSAIGPAVTTSRDDIDSEPEITALEFHRSGLNLATGNSHGRIFVYDLRSPVPLMKKEQGYDFPIQTLKYLQTSSVSSEKLMSSDRRGIKIWDAQSGDYWTGVEPAVDLNHVEWVPNSGMLLTANEGRQQHSFFIPQLGPAPKWCAFLDNLVEEMAEDVDDPNAFNTANTRAGEVYDNYKFLDMKQLRELSLDHLIGQTNLLRPYMHGYFVAQKLYEQARLLTNPNLAQEQRQKSIQDKINKERESRIRGNKKIAVKVNRKFAEQLVAREEANERRKALRVLRQGGDEPKTTFENGRDDEKGGDATDTAVETAAKPIRGALGDDRFAAMFEDEQFTIDETSREFREVNPSTVVGNGASLSGRELKKRGLTAVEEDELDDVRGSDMSEFDDDDNDEGDDDVQDGVDSTARSSGADARRRVRYEDENAAANTRIGSVSYKRSGQKPQRPNPSTTTATNKQKQPRMRISSSTSTANFQRQQRDRHAKSFGDLASSMPSRGAREDRREKRNGVVGEKEITFAPASKSSKDKNQSRSKFGAKEGEGQDHGREGKRGGGVGNKDRRSASGNVFRRI